MNIQSKVMAMANQDPDKKAAEAAAKEAERERKKAEAEEARKQKESDKQAKMLADNGLEDDVDYQKALNELGGLTLVPEGKAKKNATVEQVSDKVYPGGVVIAKRL